MFVGIGRLEFLVPGSGSLKAKRHVVKGILGGVRSKFNVAITEIDHQDLWQRATMGLSCVTDNPTAAEKVIRDVQDFVERDHRIDVIARDVYVVRPEE